MLQILQRLSEVSPFNSMFTPESIYGPDGKLQWLWSLSWDSEEVMKSDLYSNMGGGVPIEIIDELVQIAVAKNKIT